MKSFLEHAQPLAEEKNTHMTHLEDAVISGGVKGARQSIFALRDMRDMLGGKKDGTVSVKWDGAPAIFAGTDPRDGQFFVAKKGIFNKNPKIYKTQADIDEDISAGDLNKKMSLALQYLPKLGIKGIVQGDFLFAREDLKKDKIDGETYLTFHPNTLVYAIPYDSKTAKEILRSKIGIVWHTSYKGNSFQSLSASYGVDVGSFRNVKEVWSQDAVLRDVRQATLTKKETEQVNDLLKQIGQMFNRIAGSTLRELEKNPELVRLIETFNNSFIRQGNLPPPPKEHTRALINWINERFQKEIDSRKSERGKTAQSKKRDEILKFFSPRNRRSIENMFELQAMMRMAKLIFIRKLNRLNTLDTFVRTRDGYKVSGAEGFVAVDTLSGNALKLVDRLEFSYNNFSPDVVKGWQTATRR